MRVRPRNLNLDQWPIPFCINIPKAHRGRGLALLGIKKKLSLSPSHTILFILAWFTHKKMQWAVSLERTAFLKVFTGMPTTSSWTTGWEFSACAAMIFLPELWKTEIPLKSHRLFMVLGGKNPIRSFNHCQFCPTTACPRPALAKSSQTKTADFSCSATCFPSIPMEGTYWSLY